jgi:GTPase SAR1 family protein
MSEQQQHLISITTLIATYCLGPTPPGTRAMVRRDVRIVIAGDSATGKSTLITSLIKEAFVDRVQAIVPEITLPPEVAPEGVITKIVDTSGECYSSRTVMSMFI